MNIKIEKPGKAFGHRSSNILGDLHETHYSLTWQLLENESFTRGVIHEPCCGKNAIVDALKMKGYNKITASDLYYKDNVDFMKDETKRDYIITNPPYGNMTDGLVMHAKKVTKKKFAMLLRTNYLSGTTRLNKDVYKGLKTVYVFSRMPDLKAELRKDGKYKTAMIVYAWFIWVKGYRGSPKIKHIDNNKYSIRKADL